LHVLVACNHDFLNTDPATEFSEQALWSDQALVETFINNLYDRLDEPLTDGRMKCMLVDEAHYRGNQASTDFNNGLITQDRLPAWGSVSYLYTWNDMYKSIRYCNMFFENVDNIPFSENIVDGKNLRDRMTGEVHFLRAFFYFNLSKIYGGVPIIKGVFSLDDEFKTARNSYEETVNFILEELNQAIELLPSQHSGVNRGRITKGAAMALKSRVTLYAASDLYNSTISRNTVTKS